MTQYTTRRQFIQKTGTLACGAAVFAQPTFALAGGGAIKQELSNALRLFTRMYRPHAAWEDTVLFPAFRSIVSDHEYSALGEEFEEKEHALFGKEGFEKIVADVSELERTLGINNLAGFTAQFDYKE